MNDQAVPMQIGWAVRRSNVVANFEDYIEMGDSKFTTVASNTGGPSNNILNGSVDVSKWLGLSPTNSRLEAQFDGNPDETLFLHVWVTGDGISEPGNMALDVVLDYQTIFREKKRLTTA